MYERLLGEKTKGGLTDIRPACSAKPSNLALPSASTSPVRERLGGLGCSCPFEARLGGLGCPCPSDAMLERDEVKVLIVPSLSVATALSTHGSLFLPARGEVGGGFAVLRPGCVLGY